MASTKRNKMDVYRRRQNILLACIVGIIIALILMIVYFIVFDNNEGISQTADNSSASDSLKAVPADAKEDDKKDTAKSGDICFAEDTITLNLGDKVTPEILNGTVDDITDWQSVNNDIIAVSDNGEISAIGSHEELMQTSEIYRDIYKSQMKEGGEA